MRAPAEAVDHMPCEDPRRNSQLSREMNFFYREQHCPSVASLLNPAACRVRVPWPERLHMGSSEIDQLGKFFAAFGTPRLHQWLDMVYLPAYSEYEFAPPQPLCSLFPMARNDALDLLSKMFKFDLKVRISAEQALKHRYLSSVPTPTVTSKASEVGITELHTFGF